MFKLRYTEAAEVVLDSLPDEARDELYEELFNVREEPWTRTDSRSDDPQDVERLLVLARTVSALIIIDAPPVQRIRLMGIDYLG